MVVLIGEQLRSFGDHRRGYDTTHPRKRKKHFDIRHSLSVLTSAEFFQYFPDAPSYYQALLM